MSGLCRQNSYKFLEFFEQQSISGVKNVIKDVVLSVLDISQDTTLTNLVRTSPVAPRLTGGPSWWT